MGMVEWREDFLRLSLLNVFCEVKRFLSFLKMVEWHVPNYHTHTQNQITLVINLIEVLISGNFPIDN